MAVRIIPCANGSAVAVWPSLTLPRIGGLPDGPPTIRINRLTALPISNSPSNIRVRLRSSSRYTPTLVRPPTNTSGTRRCHRGIAPPVAARPFDVHPRAQAAQHVEHQADDDQVHAEVEEQRGDELDGAQAPECRTAAPPMTAPVRQAAATPPRCPPTDPARRRGSCPRPAAAFHRVRIVRRRDSAAPVQARRSARPRTRRPVCCGRRRRSTPTAP